jgi:hypothetical protein
MENSINVEVRYAKGQIVQMFFSRILLNLSRCCLDLVLNLSLFEFKLYAPFFQEMKGTSHRAAASSGDEETSAATDVRYGYNHRGQKTALLFKPLPELPGESGKTEANIST